IGARDSDDRRRGSCQAAGLQQGHAVSLGSGEESAGDPLRWQGAVSGRNSGGVDGGTGAGGDEGRRFSMIATDTRVITAPDDVDVVTLARRIDPEYRLQLNASVA